MTQDNEQHWQDYITIPAFDKRMNPSNFVDNKAPAHLLDKDLRFDYLTKLTYKEASLELKSSMKPESYKSLNGAFRAFKYKKNKSLATINIEKPALEQLQRVQRNLGLNEYDSSFTDTILWLTSPPVRREEDTLQALFDANNECEFIEFGDRPTSSILRQLTLLQSRMSYGDQKLLQKIVEHTFINGWISKKGTRSDSPDKIKERLEHDEIFNVVSDFKSGT
ncbi:hypothetical protein ACMAZF_20415 (plasmid) [Psychrobium sp. nBUS_13]|uniref:hypothetical protein n=1 Tax=Psychrobium sp. nBUS_13 TaxID=3395319 RepID=UPI003EB8FEB3